MYFLTLQAFLHLPAFYQCLDTYRYSLNYLFLQHVSTIADSNTLGITIITIINGQSSYRSFSHLKHGIKDHRLFHCHIAPHPQDSEIPIGVGKKLYTFETVLKSLKKFAQILHLAYRITQNLKLQQLIHLYFQRFMCKTKARNALHKAYPYFPNIFSSARSLMLLIFRKDAECCQITSADQESPGMQTWNLTWKYFALLKT